jgi:hypothetical protein
MIRDNMFIQEVISKIREPHALQFNETKKKAEQLETPEKQKLKAAAKQELRMHPRWS